MVEGDGELFYCIHLLTLQKRSVEVLSSANRKPLITRFFNQHSRARKYIHTSVRNITDITERKSLHKGKHKANLSSQLWIPMLLASILPFSCNGGAWRMHIPNLAITLIINLSHLNLDHRAATVADSFNLLRTQPYCDVTPSSHSPARRHMQSPAFC